MQSQATTSAVGGIDWARGTTSSTRFPRVARSVADHRGNGTPCVSGLRQPGVDLENQPDEIGLRVAPRLGEGPLQRPADGVFGTMQMPRDVPHAHPRGEENGDAALGRGEAERPPDGPGIEPNNVGVSHDEHRGDTLDAEVHAPRG